MTTAVTTPAASGPAASSGSLLDTSPGPGPWGRGPGFARHAGGPAAGTQPEALSPGPGVGRSRTGVTGPPARAEAGPGRRDLGREAGRGSCHSLPVSAVTQQCQHCQARSGTRSGCHTVTVTVNGDNGQGQCVRLSAARRYGATPLPPGPSDGRSGRADSGGAWRRRGPAGQGLGVRRSVLRKPPKLAKAAKMTR